MESKNHRVKFFGGEDSQQYVVHAYRLLGTETWVIAAYEKTDGYASTKHSSVTSFDGSNSTYGRITSRRITPEIDALPVGEARFQACAGFRETSKAFAYSLIWGVYPSLLIDGTLRFEDGDIEIECGAGFNHNPTENPPIEGNDGWKI